MNASNLILLGGAALGGWYLYNNWGSLTLPADAGMVDQVPSGQSVTVNGTVYAGPAYVYYSPTTKQYYVNSTAPTAAQLAAGNAIITAAQAANPTTPTLNPNPTPAVPVTLPVPLPNNTTEAMPTTIAGLYAWMQQWAAADTTNFTSAGAVGSGGSQDYTSSGYHWDTILNQLKNLPAPSTFKGTWPIPSADLVSDLSQQYTGTQFWAPIATYLAANGMSGMPGYGMSYFSRGMGQDPTSPNPVETYDVIATGQGDQALLVPTGGTPNAPTTQPTTTNWLPWVLVAAAGTGIFFMAKRS